MTRLDVALLVLAVLFGGALIAILVASLLLGGCHLGGWM